MLKGPGVKEVLRHLGVPPVPPTRGRACIGVDDIDHAAAAITEHGGKILNGPMEIPSGEFALNGMNPLGASFGLVGPRKA